MEKRSIREAYGRSLVELGRKNYKVVVCDADLSSSTKTIYFKENFPDRFVDVGIAEQNLIGVSAGLASAGKTVFASSFSVFETERALEVIRNMVCMSNLNVKICSTHAGLMTGEDGATHQSLEDISIMRTLPNMRVLVPADFEEARQMTHFIAEQEGPFYMRMVRDDLNDIYDENYKFEIGKADILLDGDDVAILSCGPMVWNSYEAAMMLKERGIHTRVINMSSIKPIDKNVIIDCAKDVGLIVTVEDHSIIGGLGSAVCEMVCENYPAKVFRLGVEDRFGMSGASSELYEYFGLTPKSIADKVENIFNNKY
ncbi:MAG: transketolase family protein [Peptostreptococcus porci]|uniref:transketolase family protein n=1 Tax=Peptostreptococcus porci TaxID=2652282 RepID=UPI002A8EFD94|nr:transketolase family protein [Peptostreptococcus porci]MDY4560628.1 transketolase family protein [Peptostreptococcus porci]MDY5479194.1 transketolase family protein [Peptostreptococcus porci]